MGKSIIGLIADAWVVPEVIIPSSSSGSGSTAYLSPWIIALIVALGAIVIGGIILLIVFIVKTEAKGETVKDSETVTANPENEINKDEEVKSEDVNNDKTDTER